MCWFYEALKEFRLGSLFLLDFSFSYFHTLILILLATLNNIIKLYLKLKYFLKNHLIFLKVLSSWVFRANCSLGKKARRLFYVICSPYFHGIGMFYISRIISDHVCICYQCLKYRFCLCLSIDQVILIRALKLPYIAVTRFLF